MTAGTNFDLQIDNGRPGNKRITAHTRYGRLLVFGVNSIAHDFGLPFYREYWKFSASNIGLLAVGSKHVSVAIRAPNW